MSFLESTVLSSMYSMTPAAVGKGTGPGYLDDPVILSFPEGAICVLAPVIVPARYLITTAKTLPISIASSVRSTVYSLRSVYGF